MNSPVKELINIANTQYRNSHSELQHFAEALPNYLRSIEILLKISQAQTGRKKEITSQLVSNLLAKAEHCKSIISNPNPDTRNLPQGPSPYSSAPPMRNTRQSTLDYQQPNPNLARPQASRRNSLPVQQAPPNQYEKQIEQEIIDCSSSSVTWDSISGLTQAKEILIETIINPVLYPHIYTGLRAPPKGILLFGPPGSGKILLAKAVARNVFPEPPS